MKKFKGILWYILLAIFIGIPILLVIASLLTIGGRTFDVIKDIFYSLGDGNWALGIFSVLCVIVGMVNMIRGALILSPREEDAMERLPDWARTLIIGVSLLGTVGFIVIFFERLI